MLYKNMNKDVNLYDLIDLVHIPGINRVFASLAARLKIGDLQPCIDAYQRKERMYYEELFINNYRAGQNPPLYWFQLTQYDAWQWRITHMAPTPENSLLRHEILPRDIIERITRELVDPDKIITMKAVHSNSLNKTVDLQFVRYSSSHILGTVRENPDTAKVQHNENRVTLEGDMELAYRVFIHYTQKFPGLNKFFIQGFLKQVLPTLMEMETGQDEKIPKRKIKPFSTYTVGQDNIATWVPYHYVNQDVNLYELIRFSHVQEVNRVFALKLEELKTSELKENIEAYKSRCEKYFQAMFKGFSRQEKKLEKQGYPRLYWFDLSKFAMADWGMTRIRPWPPPYEPCYVILPDDIVQYITMYYPVNPDRAVTLEAVPSVLLGKKVDLSFVYSSSNHLFGTVRENISDWEDRFTGENDAMVMDRELSYRLFFHYLHKFPHLNEKFIQIYLNRLLVKLVTFLSPDWWSRSLHTVPTGVFVSKTTRYPPIVCPDAKYLLDNCRIPSSIIPVTMVLMSRLSELTTFSKGT